jgi:signal peptidase I
MSRSPQHATKAANKPAEASRDSSAQPVRKDGARETIESIVVAFILAFLFRTFEAEAFVIPTGSMAPTLLGQHKDVTCDKCGTDFTVGASDEMDDDAFNPDHRLKTALCPNCRYEMPIRELPSFKGDRILVNKFPYEFGEPDRWDVVVFRYPDSPSINFIKRLVGLPGEEIKIERGNVYARTDPSEPFRILRKRDPNKQLTLQLPVYDNNHPAPELHEAGWPERWAAVREQPGPDDVAGWSEDDAGWQVDTKARSFRLTPERAQDGQLRWIRYRHFVPEPSDWEAALNGRMPATRPRPQLITDFCGYNMYTGGAQRFSNFGTDIYWVGDLTMTAEVELAKVKPDSELLFELNEGVRRYRCRFDVNTGRATLSYLDDQLHRGDDEEVVLSSALTPLKGEGRFQVIFANVDDRLCLWVGTHNGLWMNTRLVDFGTAGEYEPPALPAPTERDLTPIGIAARGAAVRVSQLLLERDVYYRGERVSRDDDFVENPFTNEEYAGKASTLYGLLSEPAAWYDEYESQMEPVVFAPLKSDEFFMMGDNSPRSKDSRLWSNMRRTENRHAVERKALVGKAFFIYWPHGIPFLNDGRGFTLSRHHVGNDREDDYPRLSFPFYPNVSRMNRIR